MGSGRWSTSTHEAAAAYRAAHGVSAFAYSDSGARAVHKDLSAKGVVARESHDSVEHPESLPIAIVLDVTGSMRNVPRQVLDRLPSLLGILQRAGIDHPQIMFSAIGDATCDSVPLQVGQFESDNRMDEQLGKFVLEGGGGGQKTESYELAAYFLARHTDLHSVTKRGKRGYCFFIADELAYPAVSKTEVANLMGDGLQNSIATADIFAELKTKFDTFMILPGEASHAKDREVIEFWKAIVGQNFIALANLDALCETIATAVALGEGVALEDSIKALTATGSTAAATVTKALSKVAPVKAPVIAAPLPAALLAGTDHVARL